MPVEIKEVVIRAIINQDNKFSGKENHTSDAGDDRSAIIQACVQEVIRILKRSKDR